MAPSTATTASPTARTSTAPTVPASAGSAVTASGWLDSSNSPAAAKRLHSWPTAFCEELAARGEAIEEIRAPHRDDSDQRQQHEHDQRDVQHGARLVPGVH